MSSPSLRAFERMADETWTQIFQYLHDDAVAAFQEVIVGRRMDQSALVNVMSVCKRWYHLAVPVLYRHPQTRDLAGLLHGCLHGQLKLAALRHVRNLTLFDPIPPDPAGLWAEDDGPFLPRLDVARAVSEAVPKLIQKYKNVKKAESILHALRDKDPEICLTPHIVSVVNERHPDTVAGLSNLYGRNLAQDRPKIGDMISTVFRPQLWCQKGRSTPYGFAEEMTLIQASERIQPRLFVDHEAWHHRQFGTETGVYMSIPIDSNIDHQGPAVLYNVGTTFVDYYPEWMAYLPPGVAQGLLARTRVVLYGLGDLLRRMKPFSSYGSNDFFAGFEGIDPALSAEGRDRQLESMTKEFLIRLIMREQGPDYRMTQRPSEADWRRIIEIQVGPPPPCPVCGDKVEHFLP